MNGYELAKQWREWSFSRRGVKPIHHAIMHHIFAVANEARWADEFQLPTDVSCQQLGISNPRTFRQALQELNDLGAVKIVQNSVNQHEARWVSLQNCLYNFCPSTIPGSIPSTIPSTIPGTISGTIPSTVPGIAPNIKHINSKQENNKTIKHIEGADAQTQDDFSNVPSGSKKFTKPTELEISDYVRDRTGCSQIESNRFATKFFNWYESNGWMVGKSKMKDWMAAVRTWLAKEPIPSEQSASNNPQHMEKKKYYRNEWDYDLNMWVKKEYDKPLYV